MLENELKLTKTGCAEEVLTAKENVRPLQIIKGTRHVKRTGVKLVFCICDIFTFLDLQ